MDDLEIRFPVLRSGLVSSHNDRADVQWDTVNVYNQVNEDRKYTYEIQYLGKKTRTNDRSISLEVQGADLRMVFVQKVRNIFINHPLEAIVKREVRVVNPKLAISNKNYFPRYISTQYKRVQSATGSSFVHVVVSLEG